MKFCENHWEELRVAIEAQGLGQFISKSGEDAMKRMAAEETEGSTRTNFDPLMFAHNAIVSNSLSSVGLGLFNPNDDGSERCPLCTLINGCPCDDAGTDKCAYAKWIGFAATDALDEAKKLGLVGSG